MMDMLGWVLVVVLAVLLVAVGALISSLLNHRTLQQMRRDTEHAKANAKMAAQAVARIEAKQKEVSPAG